MKKIKVSEIISGFKTDYPQLMKKGARISGIFGEVGNTDFGGGLHGRLSCAFQDDDLVNPLQCEMNLWVGFFTDHRKIPKFYKGIKVNTVVDETTEPLEFKFDDGTRDFISLEEVNLPQRYIDYVLDHPGFIREKLGDAGMTIDDMLDALCWGDFKKYKGEYERKIRNAGN